MSVGVGRGRQSKRISKTRHNMRWETENYDYLLRLAEDECVSVPVIANRIVRKARLGNVPRGIEKP